MRAGKCVCHSYQCGQKYVLLKAFFESMPGRCKFVGLADAIKKSNVLKTELHLDENIRAQIEKFERGTKYVQLLRPATIGGGIFKLKSAEVNAAIDRFERCELSRIKFVPASGAATRMFKKVFSWLENPLAHKPEIDRFFTKVEELAFFEDWLKAADHADVETFETGLDAKVRWLELMLFPEGLGLSEQPKGLIDFHSYDQPQLPLVEHMKETMQYAISNGKGRLHFTVSPEHLKGFEKAVAFWTAKEPFNTVEWDISFSHQALETDTIAVDQSNEPIVEDGQFLRRPGGHGALIHNLNRLDEALVFIKNIDNVAHERLLPETVRYKKVLAGKLIELREDMMKIQVSLEKGLLDENQIQALRDKWKIRIPKGYKSLKAYLKRPMRVCGMVKNEGEPGGGPFWTVDDYTGEALQIVEQAQIDPNDSRQQSILKSSTHFNPVDIVCLLKDLKGKPIDLLQYVDDALYFVASKTHKGKNIKALEWPGLWNGAMANWITIFVEVPITTFNPVKEVSDLFRSEHLSK